MAISEALKQKIIVAISVIIAIDSCLVMAGWIFGINSLTGILPSVINMKFPTAFTFLLSASALYFLFRIISDNDEVSFIFLPGLALMMLLVMGSIFIAGAASLQTGIEELFVNTQNSVNSSGSGIPAVIAMINFILFGLVCINSLIISPQRQEVIKFVGWFIVIVSFISLIGYLFSVPALYFSFDAWTPIALNSAVMFFLLGYGLIVISKIKPVKIINEA